MLKDENYKKVITKTERLQIEGLMILAHQAYKQMSACDKAMAKILNYSSKYGISCGLLSDAYFNNDYNVVETLKAMEIKIK